MSVCKQERAFAILGVYSITALLLSVLDPAFAEAVLNGETESRQNRASSASDKSAEADAGAANSAGRAEKADSVSPEKINKVLESEDVYGEQFRVSSYFNADRLIVQTWTDPRSVNPEHDYRVHSVLIAKKLLDAFPESIKVCSVRYFDRLNPRKYAEVTVVPGVVRAYAAGIMSESDLLTTLPMTYFSGETAKSPASGVSGAESGELAGGDGRQSPAAFPANQGTMQMPAAAKRGLIDPSAMLTVQPGPEQAARADLLKRVHELEKKGVRSLAAMNMLAIIEEQVRDGKVDEAHVTIARLKVSIEDMEKSYLRAKATKPVPPAHAYRSGGSASAGSPGSSQNQSRSSASSGSFDPASFEEGIAIFKRKMGDFYPHYGPSYVDRVNIANQIIKMQQGAQNVEQFRIPFLRMEATVLNGGIGLEQEIKSFNEKLQLQAAPHDEEYNYQQRLADEKKGRDK